MSELPEILFLGIALYVLYRFIFNFILPIARTTRQVRQQFRNVQETMRNQQGGPYQQDPYGRQQGYGPQQPYGQQQGNGGANGSAANGPAPRKPATPPNDLGEYIDFEEIK